MEQGRVDGREERREREGGKEDGRWEEGTYHLPITAGLTVFFY